MTGRLAILVFAALTLSLVAGCGDAPWSAERSSDVESTVAVDATGQVEYAPDVGPEDFVTGIDNPFFPMSPGNGWVYEATTFEGLERVEVTVTDETREVMGVPVVVVRDTVTVNGEVVEDTYDWFAQDKDGNVWYLGEDSREYEDGEVVSTEGSWEAGVSGALPGIMMWASPEPGAPYRQEYLAGVAEDMARVIQLDGDAQVPFGAFTDVLVTEEWTPLETGQTERKYYVRGVGLVLEEGIKRDRSRLELLSMIATE